MIRRLSIRVDYWSFFLAVQNWTHPQVVHGMLSGGDSVSLRVSPLDQTSIKQGTARKSVGKLARRKGYKQKLQRRALEKKNRKTSLFRRLSGKRASAELSSLGYTGGLHPAMQRSASTSEGMTPTGSGPASVGAGAALLVRTGSISTASGTASSTSVLRNLSHTYDSSSSSSPCSSVPNSPASPFISALQTRPSTLHGLKHKLAQTLRSPTRRKHAQTMPLSPLARADPSAMAKDSTAPTLNMHSASTKELLPPNAVVQQTPSAQISTNPTVVAVSNHLSTSPSRSPSPLALGCVSTSPASTRARSGSSVKKTITKPKKSTDSMPSGANLLLQTLYPGQKTNHTSDGYDSKSS